MSAKVKHLPTFCTQLARLSDGGQGGTQKVQKMTEITADYHTVTYIAIVWCNYIKFYTASEASGWVRFSECWVGRAVGDAW